MEDALTSLCQACGLCCDGSLFGRVPLAAEEVAPARRNRLRVVASAKSFEQSCTALAASRAGRSCAIYAERPEACLRFTCLLYERHVREGGPLEPRLVAVRRVRELLCVLEESGALDEASLTELTRLIGEDFARA